MNIDAIREQAFSLAETGQFEKAIPLFREIVRMGPLDVEGWHGLGHSLDAVGNYAEAIACFDRALGAVPSPNIVLIETLNSKGDALRKIGRLNEAVELFKKVVKLDEKHEFGWNNLGICQKNLGAPGDAEFSFQKALAANPNSLRALCNLGQLYATHEISEPARDCCRKLESLGKNDPMALLGIAAIYANLKDKQAAIKTLAQLRRVAPNHPDASRLEQFVASL